MCLASHWPLLPRAEFWAAVSHVVHQGSIHSRAEWGPHTCSKIQTHQAFEPSLLLKRWWTHQQAELVLS